MLGIDFSFYLVFKEGHVAEVAWVERAPEEIIEVKAVEIRLRRNGVLPVLINFLIFIVLNSVRELVSVDLRFENFGSVEFVSLFTISKLRPVRIEN